MYKHYVPVETDILALKYDEDFEIKDMEEFLAECSTLGYGYSYSLDSLTKQYDDNYGTYINLVINKKSEHSSNLIQYTLCDRDYICFFPTLGIFDATYEQGFEAYYTEARRRSSS